MNKLAILLFLLLSVSAFWSSSQAQAHERGPQSEGIRILVYTHTNGYRHQSIEKGVAVLRELAEKEGIGLDHTEDSLQFNPKTLSKYRLVIFLSTTGDVLGPEGETAFRNFIEGGGSFMGIHAATDTEYHWPWYGKLVGAYFESHPAQQPATLKISDPNHPATAHLPGTWRHYDEWYNFRDIQPGLHVVLSLDESSYTGGTNGVGHPIAWCHELSGGRAFYTGLGHTEAAFDEENFRQHLAGGIRYCLGTR